MDTRWARVARGTVAAAVATFVAAFSHAIAGDAPPSWLGVGASFVLSLTACAALAGRRLSWWRLAASVAVSQVLFHGLFAGVGVPVAASGHVHGAAPGALVAGERAASDGWMLLAHVIAGVLTLLALRFGERAFWSVVDSARLVLRRLLRAAVPVVAAPGRGIHPAARSARPRRAIHVPSTHRHRGPPLQFV